jgi:hypothetical protein
MCDRSNRTGEAGIAMVVAVLFIAILSGLGLSLLVTLGLEPRASANQRDGAAALFAADAAIELASLELDRTADWDGVLAGTVRASKTDGEPSGTRDLASGGQIDLSTLTNRLTCGAVPPCSDAQRSVSTNDRPWGANNPLWRPFLYGAPSALGLSTIDADYVIVWVGDDGMEVDGEVEIDGGAAGGDGRLILRLHAMAFGPHGARRAIESVLRRRCHPSGAPCEPGSRVQSWRSLHGAIP